LPKQPDNTQEFRRRVGSKVHYVVVEHCSKVIKVIITGWGGEDKNETENFRVFL